MPGFSEQTVLVVQEGRGKVVVVFSGFRCENL